MLFQPCTPGCLESWLCQLHGVGEISWVKSTSFPCKTLGCSVVYRVDITLVSDRDTLLSHPGNFHELNVVLMFLCFKTGTFKISPKNFL